MDTKRWSVITTALAFLVLVQLDLVWMGSDTTSMFCREVCWGENALAVQCEQEKGCNAGVQNNVQYSRCSEPCYTKVASCQMMCRNNFETILDQCLSVCTDLDFYEHCMLYCFTDKALQLKFKKRKMSLRGKRRRSGRNLNKEQRQRRKQRFRRRRQRKEKPSSIQAYTPNYLNEVSSN